MKKEDFDKLKEGDAVFHRLGRTPMILLYKEGLKAKCRYIDRNGIFLESIFFYFELLDLNDSSDYPVVDFIVSE